MGTTIPHILTDILLWLFTFCYLALYILGNLANMLQAPKLFRRSPNRAKSGTNENHANGTSKIDEKFATKRVQKKWHGLHQFMTSSNILLLLGFVPFSILGGHFEWNPTFVFSMSMLAILPLAMLLSNATEELSKEAGEVVGALLNATFGNAVEMIVSTVALTRGEIKIVQSSMLGAILSNILLVRPILLQNPELLLTQKVPRNLPLHRRLVPRLHLQRHRRRNHGFPYGRRLLLAHHPRSAQPRFPQHTPPLYPPPLPFRIHNHVSSLPPLPALPTTDPLSPF